MTIMPNARRWPLAILLAGSMALGALMPAKAQQEISPEHLALAVEYAQMTDRGRVYETTLVELGVSTMRTLVQQDPDLIDPLPEAVQAVVDQYMVDKDELFSLFGRVYATRFTQEELQEIIGFYRSDTGQKLLGSNRAINQDMQRVLGVWESNARGEFMSRVRTVLREAGHNV
ncbi:DUF2059 domain-containing protein [Pelagibacterium montanilacus]|uniref:DUF2059 domain-containing protein n=1 Tax=Pelagibacterium montanilacus TaxID=2185280 RepID=UPI000F8EE94F|nr:DUF2059 domain-containing protein [Pelagibacterium montanilacus]